MLTSKAASEVLDEGASVPKGCGVAVVDDMTTIYLNLSGILDATKELEKLGKKEGAVLQKLFALQRTLPGYVEGTPEAVKANDEDKVSKLQAELDTVRSRIEELKQLLE
jgi:valyl-tRNA synthetase